MKKLVFGLVVAGLLSTVSYAKKLEQTICFSKSECGTPIAYGTLGDNVKLCGGKCQGKTIAQMNKNGWKLIQVVNGLQGSFGMVFIKER